MTIINPNALWWVTNDNKPTVRLLQETQIMRQTFPFMKLVVSRNLREKPPLWRGTIRLNIEDARVTEDELEHVIEIQTGTGYPNYAPSGVCLTMNKFRNSEGGPVAMPHHLGGGRMCLFGASDSVKHGWNPSRSTVATVTSWAIEWLYAAVLYSKTEQWPGYEHVTFDPQHTGRATEQRVQPVARFTDLNSFRAELPLEANNGPIENARPEAGEDPAK